MTHEGLVYIDTKRNYYSRWSRLPLKQTHAIETEEPLSQYWVEMIRATPELIDWDST